MSKNELPRLESKTKFTERDLSFQSKLLKIHISNSSFSRLKLTVFRSTITSNFTKNQLQVSWSKYLLMLESSKLSLETGCPLVKRKVAERGGEQSLKTVSKTEWRQWLTAI